MWTMRGQHGDTSSERAQSTDLAKHLEQVALLRLRLHLAKAAAAEPGYVRGCWAAEHSNVSCYSAETEAGGE